QPAILLQVSQGLDHTLFYFKLWFPAKSVDSRTVEKYERTVPYPPTNSARIGKFGFKSEMFADPSDRVIDLAILVCTQVKNGDLLRGFLDRHEHGIDAILNIEIRLALPAV